MSETRLLIEMVSTRGSRLGGEAFYEKKNGAPRQESKGP